MPLADQSRLLELTARGERAEADAIAHARLLLYYAIDDDLPAPVERLALASTGVTASFEERLFSTTTPEYLSQTVWGDLPPANRNIEGRWPKWGPEYAAVWRRRSLRVDPGDLAEGVVVTRSGGVVIYRGVVMKGDTDSRRGLDSLVVEELSERFERWLTTGREILAELGTHGDVRLAYRLATGGRLLHVRKQFVELPETDVETWAGFEDESVAERVFAELARGAGLGPVEEAAG